MHFRSIKDSIATPLHHTGGVLARLPKGASRCLLGSVGLLGKTAYLAPGSRIKKMVGNFCRAAGRTDPWPIYSRMVNNLEEVALQFARLHRYGRDELLAQTTIDPSFQAFYQQQSKTGKGGLILVPHCAGAVLSSARLSTFCPTVLLVREPKDPRRCALMLDYVKKLGPELILVRNAPPATVMRNIMRALHAGKVVVGTTDLVKKSDDTVETKIFGQPIHSPGWPARLSERLEAPIIPGYIHMEPGKIALISDEIFVATDLAQSTQRWVSSFERRFKEYPSDWVFMLDKNWGRVLAAAAGAAK